MMTARVMADGAPEQLLVSVSSNSGTAPVLSLRESGVSAQRRSSSKSRSVGFAGVTCGMNSLEVSATRAGGSPGSPLPVLTARSVVGGEMSPLSGAMAVQMVESEATRCSYRFTKVRGAEAVPKLLTLPERVAVPV